MIIIGETDHTSHEERKSNKNDTDVPQGPEVCCVERRACVQELDELYVLLAMYSDVLLG